MKRTLIFVCLLLTACAPSLAPPVVPAPPTAYIDPSYPTVESAPALLSQVSSGIEVRAERARTCSIPVDLFWILDQPCLVYRNLFKVNPACAATHFRSSMFPLTQIYPT